MIRAIPQKYKVIGLVLVTVALAVIQRAFGALCTGFTLFIDGLFGLKMNDSILLMLQHILMFVILLIPTLNLQKKKGIDFGYRKPRQRSVFLCILIATAAALVFSAIDGLFRVKLTESQARVEYFIFQLLFSGTGEEILYRAVPIVVLDWFCSGINTRIKNKKIDLPIVLSTLLFTIAHIPNYIGQPFYAVVYGLVVITVLGAIYGWVYRKSGSIWICMLCHGLANVVLLVFPTVVYLVL